MAGRYDEAEKTARAGLALDTSYKKELLSAMAAVALNRGQWGDALKQYQALISSYPDYFDGYCGTGAVMLIERKFSDAVRYLNEAARHAQNPIIYRHLTIAYAQLHQHQQAVEAFDRAYRLNPNVVGDKDAIHAAARSLMFLGNYRAADGAIKLLLKANPAAGSDPEVQQSERIIQEKLQDQAAR
jgi:tetratricopeptide (TPR) repeat protein